MRGQSVRVEPVLGYEYGYPLTIERSAGLINHFQTSGNGRSFNHTVGLGAVLYVPGLFSSSLGISPRLEYRLGLGKFTSDPYSALQYDPGLQPIRTTDHFEVKSLTHSIDLVVPVQLSSGAVSFGFGPWASLEVSRSITGTEFIDAPANAHFLSGGRSHEFASGDTISASHVHTGLEADISWRIGITSALDIEPGLYGRMDLGSSAAPTSRSFSGGLCIAIATRAVEKPAVAVRDTPVATARPAQPKLLASIHFTKNGIRTEPSAPVEVVGYHTYFRQYTEIAHCIVFDSGSSVLSPRYALLDSASAATFSIASLARADLGEFARQLPNVIGYRMAADPSASLELTAGPKRLGDHLSRSRFDVIERYLGDAWGVSHSRIHTSMPDASAQSASSDTVWLSGQTLLAPVAAQWIEHSYHIPHMGIEKAIAAEDGVRSWVIEIRQNSSVLARFTSRDSSDEGAIADFDLAGDSSSSDLHRNPAPLVATLRAEDFSGHEVLASDTLRLPTHDEQLRNITEREAVVFVFLPEGSASSESTANHELMMQKLLHLVRPDARITITSPSGDRAAASMSALSVAERIVTELEKHTELHPDLHILGRTKGGTASTPYERAVVVRIDQSK